jgi:uncharacterized protein YodC (DUF2158 family)
MLSNGAHMLTATTNQTAQFCVGDVVTLKTGGPRMTVTYVGPVEYAVGDWLLCQWFDAHGEFRQDMFSHDMVNLEPRSIPPGLVHLHKHGSAARSTA